MIRKVSKLQEERNRLKSIQKRDMFNLFLKIWDERMDKNGDCYCFETGKKLPREIYRDKSTCYHHVLAKQDMAYPQYILVERNIVILHPNIHAMVEQSLDSCPKTKQYRNELISLHEMDKLK